MAQKRGKPKPPDLSTYEGRIAFLLAKVWAGNQSVMARDLGVSQPVISQTSRGVRAPGRSLLNAIASYSKVNSLWLYQGVGEPLVASGIEVPGKSWQIPLAPQLLPGPPSDHAALLTGGTLPVAEEHFSLSRYFYCVASDDPILSVEEEKVARGDLILMETDFEIWRNNLRNLKTSLCAVRQRSKGGERYCLGRVTTKPGTSESVISAFGTDLGQPLSDPEPEENWLYGVPPRRWMPESNEDKDLMKSEIIAPDRQDSIDQDSDLTRVSASLDDIVSVAILLVRI